MPRYLLLVLSLVLGGLVLLGGGCKEDKKLKVTGLDPNTGEVAGGTRVIIKGNRFTKDGARNARVYFNNKPADVLGFRGDGELLVRAPGGELNQKVDVLIIFEPGGEITLKQAYQYVEKEKVDVDDLDTSKPKK
jgi:hypothetical protein